MCRTAKGIQVNNMGGRQRTSLFMHLEKERKRTVSEKEVKKRKK